MNEETAFNIFAAILAGGIVTWLCTLLVHRRVFRPADPSNPQVLAYGELMIEAQATVVREKTVSVLRGGLPGIGPIRLAEADDRRIAGEIRLVGGGSGAHRRSPVGQSVGFLVELEPEGASTSVSYRISGSGGGCLKTASGMFVYIITPLVLATAGYVVPTFIVGSEEPAVRYQVFQTFQIIHFLWPPFLFAGLRNRVAKVVVRSLADVLRNSAF